MNEDELWRTTALTYVDKGQHYTVSRRTPDKEVWPKFEQKKGDHEEKKNSVEFLFFYRFSHFLSRIRNLSWRQKIQATL